MEHGVDTMVNASLYKDSETVQADIVIAVHLLTKEIVVKILNSGGQIDKVTTSPGSVDTTTAGQEGSARRRRRRRGSAASHDVELVNVDPPVKDGHLRTAIVATKPGHYITLHESRFSVR